MRIQSTRALKAVSRSRLKRERHNGDKIVTFLSEAFPLWTTKIPHFVLALISRVKVEDYGKYSVYTAYMFGKERLKRKIWNP